MTPIGIIRKVDDLGRIVIPKEIRKFYHINANDEIEIVTTPDGIIESGKAFIYDDLTKKLENLSPKQRQCVSDIIDAYLKSL